MNKDIEALVRRADLVERDDHLEGLFGDDLSRRLLRQITDLKEGRMPETRSTHTGGGPQAEPAAKEAQKAQTPTTRSPAPRQRRWVPALVAASAVIILGLGYLAFIAPDDGPPVASDPDSIVARAIAAADSMVEAYNAYDPGLARQLMDDEVRINSPSFFDLEGVDNIDKLGAVMAFNSVIGFQYLEHECALSFRPAEVRPTTLLWVVCTYQLDSRLQRAVDYPPIEGTLGVGVVDGVITRLDEGFPFEEWGPNVDEPFIAWLDSNHPGAFGTLYGGGAGARYPRLTTEARDLLSTLLEEYEAAATSG